MSLVPLIEMGLRARPRCTWIVQSDTLYGVHDGQPFVLAIDSGIGTTREQQRALSAWKKAGARVGVVTSIKDTLRVLGVLHAE